MLDEQTTRRMWVIKKEIAGLEKEYEDLRSTLPTLAVDKYVTGDYVVVVGENKRFDPATAKANLTADQYLAILKPTPDSALAKAVLDEDYALTQKSYDPKITIKHISEVD